LIGVFREINNVLRHFIEGCLYFKYASMMVVARILVKIDLR